MIKTNPLCQSLLAISIAAITITSAPLMAEESTADASTLSSLAENCTYEKSTPIIPDGNIATKDELIAAQTRVKTYQGKLQDYRDCLAAAEQGLDVDAEGYEANKTALLNLRNDSVTLEEKVAAEFNGAIQIYKNR